MNQIPEPYITFRNHTLYWDRTCSYLHVVLRRSREIVAKALNICLFLLLLLNIWVLYSIGHVVDFEVERWFILMVYGTSGLVTWFWVLTVPNLYLMYRLLTGDSWHKEIDRKKIEGTNGKRINVADYLAIDTSQILDKAWRMAESRRQRPVDALHVVHQLLYHDEISLLVARLGLDVSTLRHTFMKMIEQVLPKNNSRGLSRDLLDALLKSFASAADKGDAHILVTDVFEQIVITNEKIQEVFYEFGIETEAVSNVIAWVEFQRKLRKQYRLYRSESSHKPKGSIDRAYLAAATPMLDRFSIDMTQLARSGSLPLAVGRDSELEEIFRIIEAGGTSVLMVGEQGVGKNSIIDGLANRMAAEDVPVILQDKRLVSLSVPFLIAGAAEAGELQERLLMITQEVIRSGNIILYIEDVHNLVGVGSGGTENVDLSEVLAVQVRDPRVIVIGSTSPADYTGYMEGSAINDGFTKVIINEPDRNNTIKILEANVGYLEYKHNVFFTHSALAKAVDLSDRYMHDQFLPSKAVSLISEVAAWVGARAIKKQLEAVTAEDVAALVSQKTKIPLSQMTQAETTKLLNLDAIIHQRIIGQTEAVKVVVTALQRARTELRDQKRPIVNLLFLGPTGVGKTELSKAVAESYFGDETRMIRLDMSEYQTADSVARLIGVPGSGKGGLLTEAVRKNPFSLLLLDEMEKAHSDILNVFLQVMDDGRLTDATGRTIDFTNVILIATSNAASQFIQEQVGAKVSIETIRETLVKDQLKEYFRPEFLNRFDSIVVFRPLTEEEIYQIAGLMLKGVAQRLETKGINLVVTPEAQKELAAAGYDPVFGARPLRRVIQEQVDNSLAKYLLTGSISRRDTVILKSGNMIEVDKAKKLY